MIYWLQVKVGPTSGLFGWKTSVEHWNDDAVWGQGPEPYLGPWYELRYPVDHQYYGESIDLAFRLTNDALSGVPEEEDIGRVRLYRNEPNPFSSLTTIRYSLGTGGPVKLQVFDVTGCVVSTLVDADQSAGLHHAVWSGSDDQGRQLAPGIYFCRLAVGNQSAVQKVLYLR